MSSGGYCIKNLLSETFVITDEQADQLWKEVKERWLRQDADGPSYAHGAPDGLSEEDLTSIPLINEIEEYVSGNLDTYPKDSLLEAIAFICGGVPLPVNGDSRETKEASSTAFVMGLWKEASLK